MQKNYLLLRNNQQLGPFTLGELLQLDLQPHDLVWVEHESNSWSFPHEIESLQPHLSFSKRLLQTSPAAASASETKKTNTNNTSTYKGIFVAMPMQTKKEEPVVVAPDLSPKTVLESPVSVQSTQTAEVPVYNRYNEEKVREYLHMISLGNKRKQSGFLKKAIVVCLLAGIGFVGWHVLLRDGAVLNKNNLMMQKKQFSQIIPATGSNQTKPSTTASLSTAENTSEASTEKNNSLPVAKEQTPAKVEAPANAIKDVDKHQAAAKNKQKTEIKKDQKIETFSTTPATRIITQTTPVTKEEESVAEAEKNKPIVTAIPPKEEKHENAKPAAEAPHVQLLPTNSESPLAKQLIVKFSVPDNAAGIKNAKLTLTNKNSEAISKVTIAILYHDDANIPIDKKVVYFGSLNPWQSVTVPILDNAKATDLSYRIVSVTGAY